MTKRSTSRVAAVAAATLLLALMAGTAGHASAAELLMFEEPGCPWCKRWHNEVGVGYPKSTEGQRAPLRRPMLHEPRPAGVTFAAPITVSPTFVLADKGREIGRITGYPGADFFWGLLAQLIEKLDRQERTEAPALGSRGSSPAPIVGAIQQRASRRAVIERQP